MTKLMELISKLSGYKTFFVGLCGVVYGLGTGNNEIIILSLGMMGLRDALRK